ncbi:hypothetical protein [Hydrogenophaga sp.]|uniref:hypothetical protein n=1 Tax=Hydrogenophaga sp. TaxID=1904254 RepID=UPI003F72A345
MTSPDPKTERWTQELDKLKKVANGDYAEANRECAERVLLGVGPDNSALHPAAGARMVVNMPAAHVPDFCAASKRPGVKAYLNTYDRTNPNPNTSNKRKLVDAALPLPQGVNFEDIYFGALELNGCGVRFYGDITLVLRVEKIDAKTVILDRNSYDVTRAPASNDIADVPEDQQAQKRKSVLASWSGEWAQHLGTMATIKVMQAIGSTDRRWTTGQISQSLCNDEDYIEVLKQGSFGASDLQEARVSAADAAHDALIASRMLRQPAPRLESMIWRTRRRRAEAALRAEGVPVRIVTTEGRVRG